LEITVRSFIKKQTENLSGGAAASSALLVGRLMVGLAFMALALGQIKYYSEFRDAMVFVSIPFAGTYCAVSLGLNFAGSVLFVLGFYARVGAALLFLSVLPMLAGLVFSSANSLCLAACLAVAGGLIPYAVFGGGEYGLKDVSFFRKKSAGHGRKIHPAERRHRSL